MKVAVRFSEREELKALGVIYRHSPAMVLPGRTYILDAQAVEALRAAGVKFTEVTREADAPSPEEVAAGEAI